jgi:hypothetical protein
LLPHEFANQKTSDLIARRAAVYEIRVHKTIPIHDLTSLQVHWRGEHRPVINASVKLAALATGVHLRRQISQKRGIKVAARK